ncbi:MAG: type II secretion system F family protein [Candidatus Hydrogenedentes bacterium]|nr:type II secretion system F family protein [Candidatus Hydrogenedentota bacterium]
MATMLSGGGVSELSARWFGSHYLSDSRRQQALILVTRQLSRLVKARASLVDGLLVVALDSPSPRMRDTLLAIRQDLATGDPLHKAMEKRKNFFPKYYVDLIRSGEETGRVYECLCELEEELISAARFQSHLVGHFLYIGALFGFGFCVAGFLWLFVVPTVARLLAEFNVAPPLPLRIAILYGDWFEAPLLILAVGIVVTAVYVRFKGRDAFGGRLATTLGWLALRVPGIRGIFVRRNLAHAATILFRLLGGGVPTDQALESVAGSGVSPVFQALFERVRQRVQEGESLKKAMATEPLLPKSFREQVALGEGSGYLADTLGRIARTYRREAVRASRVLVDVCTPFLLLIIATFIGLIYGSMFQAFSSLSVLPQQDEKGDAHPPSETAPPAAPGSAVVEGRDTEAGGEG